MMQLVELGNDCKMVDPETIAFLEQKAKEKGIKPIYLKGKPPTKKETHENMLHRRLNILDTNQHTMMHRLGELTQMMVVFDSKLSTIINKIEELKKT